MISKSVIGGFATTLACKEQAYALLSRCFHDERSGITSRAELHSLPNDPNLVLEWKFTHRVRDGDVHRHTCYFAVGKTGRATGLLHGHI
jgi:hypothetical protein